MNIKLLPALYALVFVLSLANCVQEVDFSNNNADQNTLVVSGAFTDGPGPHTVRLTRPGSINKQAFDPVPGAQVVLADDSGNQYAFLEVTPQGGSPVFYQLNDVKGIPGRRYTLEIRLPDGETYRSRPEVMPARVPIDSAEVRGEWYTTVNSNGTVVREPYAYVYANTTAPGQTSGPYLRWDATAVYIFNELPKIYYPIPPPQKQCFITNQISNQLVAVARLSDYQPGALVRENVGKRSIDYAFEERIGFSVYQRAITRDAYEYWQKVAQLITPTGTIFDAPPARLYGNVENLTHPQSPALGYFEVSAVDTAWVFTRNGLLGDQFVIQGSVYCDYDWSNWPPVNHPECDNCLLKEGSSLDVPYWWH